MQLSTILPFILPALILAEDSSPTSSPSSIVTKCVDKCGLVDLVCIANCVGVPAPNDAQANATNTCVAACPQGKGSVGDSQKYSECVQKCINDHYLSVSPTPVGGVGLDNTNNIVATATAAAVGSIATSNGSSSGSNSSQVQSGTATSPSGTSSPTPTKTNGVSQNKVESLLLLAGLTVLLV